MVILIAGNTTINGSSGSHYHATAHTISPRLSSPLCKDLLKKQDNKPPMERLLRQVITNDIFIIALMLATITVMIFNGKAG